MGLHPESQRKIQPRQVLAGVPLLWVWPWREDSPIQPSDLRSLDGEEPATKTAAGIRSKSKKLVSRAATTFDAAFLIPKLVKIVFGALRKMAAVPVLRMSVPCLSGEEFEVSPEELVLKWSLASGKR